MRRTPPWPRKEKSAICRRSWTPPAACSKSKCCSTMPGAKSGRVSLAACISPLKPMENEVIKELDPFSLSLQSLDQVRRFSGPVQSFWENFLASLAGVAGARLAVLAGRVKDESARWKRIAVWPANALADTNAKPLLAALEAATSDCSQQGFVLSALNHRPVKASHDF